MIIFLCVLWVLVGILGSSIGCTYFRNNFHFVMGKGDIVFFYCMVLMGVFNLIATLLIYHTKPSFSWLVGRV